MKIFRSVFLVLSTSVIGTTLATMPAKAIDFGFSFKNVLNEEGTATGENVLKEGGTVTGLIRGLEEGTGAATSVEVLTNTSGYGLGEYVGNPTSNFWTVLDGDLVAFDFFSSGINNTPPAVTNATLFFSSEAELSPSFRTEFHAGINDSISGITIGASNVTREDINLTFSRVNASCQ
jgi:hypothetical protein